MAASETTTDHGKIKSWAEGRGGKPARVKGTQGGQGTGVLRVKFTDDADLEEITWDEFFNEFDKRNLAFLHQDTTKDGKQSRFFKLVSRR